MVKHIHSEYAYFFAILGLIDPFRLLVYYCTDFNVALISIPFTSVLLYSIIEKRLGKYLKWFYVICIIIISILGNLYSLEYEIKLANYSALFIIFFYKFFNDLIDRHLINLYIAILSFYQLSLLIKVIPAMGAFVGQEYYLHITTTFQLLFGIFFTFVKEWELSLKKSVAQ